MSLSTYLDDEVRRLAAFPVAAEWAYFGNAGVAPLPRCAADAMADYLDRAVSGCQENAWTDRHVAWARDGAARLIGATADEIALIGPTAMGLNLVAKGLEWAPGDEVVCYGDDYPANVYPWRELERIGVRCVRLEPPYPGAITWDLVEAALTERTRLVSLATCHYLSGFRIDYGTIGRALRARGVYFCLDAIQTLGAWPMEVRDVDFLSADSHKWMLGPSGAGVFHVRKALQYKVRPALLGSWNVVSPQFIAQEAMHFPASGQRYEPGTLNLPGIVGMAASIDMLLGAGIDAIGARILGLRTRLLDGLRALGFVWYLQAAEDAGAVPASALSGIVSVVHSRADMSALFGALRDARVFASLRQDRSGKAILRFSPHFYNTEAEIDRALETLRRAL